MIGIGKGHGGNNKNLPKIQERELGLVMSAAILTGEIQAGTRRYKMGKCTILISPPVEDGERWNGAGWHMSISRQDRYPTWDEIAHVWYTLIPDADNRMGVMLLPPREDYINIHNYCFHIHEEP